MERAGKAREDTPSTQASLLVVLLPVRKEVNRQREKMRTKMRIGKCSFLLLKLF